MGGLGGSANQQLVPLQVDQSVTGTSLDTKPPILALVCRWLSIEIHSLRYERTVATAVPERVFTLPVL